MRDNCKCKCNSFHKLFFLIYVSRNYCNLLFSFLITIMAAKKKAKKAAKKKVAKKKVAKKAPKRKAAKKKVAKKKTAKKKTSRRRR